MLLPCGNLPLLLDLFVKSALALRGAVLLHLHTVGLRALVAGRRVVATLAFGASQYGEFTWHVKILFKVGKKMIAKMETFCKRKINKNVFGEASEVARSPSAKQI